MVFVLSLATIASYLISAPLGFIVTGVTVAAILMRNSHSLLERELHLLILTAPLYMTPVISGLPPLFSWTTFFLIVVSSTFILHGQKVNPLAIYLVILFILIGLYTGIVITDGTSGLYYLIQLVLFIFPVLLTYRARHYIIKVLNASTSDRLLQTLTSVIAAMASGVLFQWQLHSTFGIALGNISRFQSRVTYDLTIPAFSVMSGILSIGLVLGPVLWWRSSKILAVALPALSGSAILVNSSRTGLVAGSIVLVLLVLFPPRGVPKIGSRIAIIPVAGFLWWIYQAVISSERFSESGDILDDNGRFALINRSLQEFSQSFQNYIVGLGYSLYLEMPPHNFFVETLVRSGVIVCVIMVFWVTYILFYLRGNDWFYFVLALLVGAMFYSGFYAVKIFTIVAIIGIVAKSLDLKNKRIDEPLEKQSKVENSPIC